jgi:ribosomal protein S18 acetylase RimI-like enzyme
MTPHPNSDKKVSFKAATQADADALTGLIRKYYEFDQIPFHEEEIRAGLAVFLGEPAQWRAWLIQQDQNSVGYMILSMGVDLEVGGPLGTITDLYLEPEWRGQGIGRKALGFLEDFCREEGLKALELQVERDNSEAFALYHSFGFHPHDRIPMSKRIPPC